LPTPYQLFENLKNVGWFLVIGSEQLLNFRIRMPPTLPPKAFLTLLRAKMLETQVEISVLRQEYTDKLEKIESKLGKILQATELYEESSQDNNFLTPHSTLCMTFDEDKRPLVKSLKFESELAFKCHLNQRLDTSVLDKHLIDFFPRWSQIRKLIQTAIAFKKNKHDDDDDFLEDDCDESLPDGVIKFSSMKEEDEWKVYLIDTLYGVRKARTKREKGYRNIPKTPKTKNENVEDNDDEEEDQSSDEEKEEDEEQKFESADEEKEEEREKNLSAKDSVKIVEIDLTDHLFRGQLLRFIDKVWTFFDFDVFGTGDFQTVQGMKPSGVQYIFADSIHSYLTENQKTVKFLQEVHHHSKDVLFREVNLLTAEGWLPYMQFVVNIINIFKNVTLFSIQS
jgi:hypothetical protein